MVKMINLNKQRKKIKKGIKESVEVFDDLKGALGCSDIERMKLPLEFKNELDYENHCKEFIEKYKDDIIKYSNKIFLLVDSKNVVELYTILMNFTAYLVLEKVKNNGLID